MRVLPKPCLRTASPSYRSARAAQPGCPARDHDAAANSSAPHIMTRFSARSSDSPTSRACRHLQSSARRAPHTPMQEKRNASATKSASPPQKRARKRKRRKPAEQRVKPAAPLATKDAFAVLFGDATTIAARSSPFSRVAKPSGSAAFASSPSAREAKSASSAAFASSPSRAVESSAPAASPGNANDVAKNPWAAIGKRAQNLTVEARPTAAGKHVKAKPERPASTTQPSSTTSRRGRSKAARLPKRSVILSAAKDLSRPASKLSRSRSRSSKRKRAKSSQSARPPKSSRPAATPAAAITAQPISSALPPRIRIGDAMRRSGLDEYKVARTFAVVVDKLSDGKTAKDAGGVQKLLVDVLKECSRHLDPPQSERTAPAAPAQIIMLHNVPRPFRTQPLPQQQPQQQLNAAPATEPVTQSDVTQSDATAPPAPKP